MSDSEHLTIGKLVWAKVDPYPWWPGKIVKSIVQHQQVVYKIAFFADPTYTFLHRHQITPFLQQQISPNGPQHHQPALQQAVRMAHAHLSKQKSKVAPKAKELAVKQSFERLEKQMAEESLQQKSMIPQQREGMSSKHITPADQQTQWHLHIDSVNAENVIQVLEYEQRRQKKVSYSYETRKQEIRFQDKLKEKLLEKYNLLNFSNKTKRNGEIASSKTIIQITVNHQKNIVQKKHKKITKTNNNRHICNTTESIKALCLRKIKSILKNRKESGESVRWQSMQIVRRILALSDSNQMKMKSLFVALIRIISASSAEMSSQQRLGDFKLYLQRLQGEKGQDEQGSKLTQIDNSVN